MRSPRARFTNSLLRSSSVLVIGLTVAGAGGAQEPAPKAEPGAVRATSPDPRLAVRQEVVFNGAAWGLSYHAAMEKAKAQRRPILVEFTAVDCPNCQLMEQRTLAHPDVVSLLAKFVPARLYVDSVPIGTITPAQRRALAKANSDRQVDLAGYACLPVFAVVSPDGRAVDVAPGFSERSDFIKFLVRALGGSNTATTKP